MTLLRRTALSAVRQTLSRYPRVRREIEDAHDRGPGVEGKRSAADGEFLDSRLGGGAILLQQFGEVFKAQHGA